ncbi:hypothetical protein, partial [Sporosarcina sp. NCCP-2222]|uniref:hypothetical protein n=1 Tax=Sporosarcina sp. NCCP-2222 TaxID=2935073 RepID=UPI0020C012E8
MKNTNLKYGFLSLGVCTAILLAPAMANADETSDNSFLDVELNLLDNQESDPALLNVELTNVPVVGDVKVSVPSKRDEDGAAKETLASVNVERGIIEDIDVSVLEKSEEKTDTTAETKNSLVSVGVKSDLTKDLNIGVAPSEKSDSNGSSSYDGGLVEVNAENLPLLGETNVGVLD